ncbi:MAG: hypothetical protein ACRDSH_14275, partial [Pseudonocardiaceae bacterium]
AGHVGFGSLEVRRSTRDGRMLITEPTVGRPDLQTALAAAAGVNLVDMAYRDALRMPAPPSRPSREAIWIHETAFPRSVLVAARHRRLDGHTLLAALRTRRTPTGAFFSDRDLLPLVLETAKVANKILRAALVIGRRRPKPPLITRRGGSTWLSRRARFLSATRTHPVGGAQTDGADPQDRGTALSGFDSHHLQPGANGDGDHDGQPTSLLANSSSRVTATGNGTNLPR